MPFCFRRSRLSQIESYLRLVLFNQNTLLERTKKMAIDINQLTSDVNALKITLTTGLQNLADEIAALKASNPGTDFTALDAIVTGMTAQVQAADPGAQTPPNPPVSPATT